MAVRPLAGLTSVDIDADVALTGGAGEVGVWCGGETARYRFAAAGFRELGDLRGEAAALREFGLAQLARGELGAARASVERALANLRRLADRLAAAHALVTLARLNLAEGSAEAAPARGRAGARGVRGVRRPPQPRRCK